MKKINIRTCLIYIILLTMILTGITFSRHITTSVGGDEGRVASISDIEIIQSGDFVENNKMIIIPGQPLSYKPVLQFEGSEVSTCVFIEMILSDDWEQIGDNKYSIRENDEDLASFEISDKWTYLKKHNNSYIFYKELSPNKTINESLLKNDEINISKYVKENNIQTMNDDSIKFKATVLQVENNLNVEDLWDSIN